MTMKKKNKLSNIKLDEVSLVDKGANQEAFILLHKRDQMEEKEILENQEDSTVEVAADVEKSAPAETAPADVAPADVKKNEFTEKLAIAESFEDLWKLQGVLRDAVQEVIESDGENKVADVFSVIDSYANALKERMATALSKRDEDVASIAELEKKLSFVEKINDEQKKYFQDMDEVAKKDLLAKEDAVEELTKRISEDEVVVLEGAEIRKSKVGNEAFAIISKAVSEKAEAERKYQEEVAKREHEECIAKAKETLDGYSCEEEVLEKAYKAYASMSDEDRASFDIIFKIGSAAIAGLKEQVNNPCAVAKELTDQEKVEKALQTKQ